MWHTAKGECLCGFDICYFRGWTSFPKKYRPLRILFWRVGVTTAGIFPAGHAGGCTWASSPGILIFLLIYVRQGRFSMSCIFCNVTNLSSTSKNNKIFAASKTSLTVNYAYFAQQISPFIVIVIFILNWAISVCFFATQWLWSTKVNVLLSLISSLYQMQSRASGTNVGCRLLYTTAMLLKAQVPSRKQHFWIDSKMFAFLLYTCNTMTINVLTYSYTMVFSWHKLPFIGWAVS